MKFYIDIDNNDNWHKIISNKLDCIYFNLKTIVFYKSGKCYNIKNASYIRLHRGDKIFILNDKIYGNNKMFTKESWRRFTRELKLKTFL